jgi:pseudouridine synthase
MSEKLQKILSHSGYGSRRACERIISDGRVMVNGQVAIVGQRADLGSDEITIDGQSLKKTDLVYIKVYKPRGVLSSTVDELNRGRPTVRDIVPLQGHLYPVGRLDKQSEGLILLTNDGPLTHHLTHPRFGHSKVYEVTIEGMVKQEMLDLWRNGLMLDGKRTAPVNLKVVNQDSRRTRLRIVMREGRKRQIRRVASRLGYPVLRLVRINIGPIELGNLKPGEWRHLTSGEVINLRNVARRGQKNS